MGKAGIYILAGVVFIIFGIFSFRKNKAKKDRCTMPVQGQITSVNKIAEENDNGHKKQLSYEPVFQYSVNGQTFEKASNISSRDKNEYIIGQTAELLCNPVNPDEFIVKEKSVKSGNGFSVAMLLFGLSLIILGITQF